jgi:metallo-beta-lactamase class B
MVEAYIVTSWRIGASFASLLIFGCLAFPARAADHACLPDGAAWPENWTTPYPAHRVIGNLYAVGTTDLAVFLITTPDGHMLVNTGLADSAAAIQANVERLGFQLEDVKVLLTTQAHFDHTAALAEIKRVTGAQMWATAKDARVLADGGASDAQFGECTEFRFAPVAVDRVLADGEVIEFGGMRITTHLHPGHTEGSSSYSWVHEEGGRSWDVAIVNMGSINPGKRLVLDPTYSGVADDFAMTFRRQKAMPVDVWVASHGSQYGLADKHAPDKEYNPDAFVDPEGFLAEVTRLEQLYLEQLAQERH